MLNRYFFTFDLTFGEDITNKQVYDEVARSIVEDVAKGFNGTIFAYGQTSSADIREDPQRGVPRRTRHFKKM